MSQLKLLDKEDTPDSSSAVETIPEQIADEVLDDWGLQNEPSNRSVTRPSKVRRLNSNSKLMHAILRSAYVTHTYAAHGMPSVHMRDETRRFEARLRLLKKVGEEDVPPEWSNWTPTNDVFKMLRGHLRGTKWSDYELRDLPWDIMEYVGKNIRTPDEGRENDSWEPWAVHAARDIEQFEEEIKRFLDWVEPTSKEIQARRSVGSLAIQIVKNAATGMDAHVFGTETTGLATILSDIDIRLFEPAMDDMDLSEVLQQDHGDKLKHKMAEVADAIASHPDFDQDTISFQPVPFPLVQATHTPSGITIQVVAGPQSHHSRTFVLSNLEEFPVLKPLYFILKTALSHRDMLTTYQGHLSSYGLFNLLVASVRARQTMYDALVSPPVYPSDDTAPIFNGSRTINPAHFFPSLWPANHPTTTFPSPTPSPAFSLLDTLHFLGHLNTYRHGLSARTGLLFAKRNIPSKTLLKAAETSPWQAGINNMARLVPWQNYLLSLQDGADPTNDLGRKASGWKHTQATISALSSSLHKALDLSPPPPSRISPDQSSPSTTSPSSTPSNTSPSPPQPPAFSQTELLREAGPSSPAYSMRRWTLSSGLAPLEASMPRRAPLLRQLVGRIDVAWAQARTRMEVFADGGIGWCEAGARREESEEVRRERREGFLRKLNVRKEGSRKERGARRRAEKEEMGEDGGYGDRDGADKVEEDGER
ncbi:hypothetical protein KVT40_002809 [Elsinoe batatas]|uniref:Polymerase nucleotidyl transferase domain-containing protein n=1 Tax=Elsinoe batatas TaxID=2601811 RepID=A0A8K0L5N6_9PEZI|nr:hypothetical protein KVT40_002809 [Elsinoe batatas]